MYAAIALMCGAIGLPSLVRRGEDCHWASVAGGSSGEGTKTNGVFDGGASVTAIEATLSVRNDGKLLSGFFGSLLSNVTIHSGSS